MKEKYLYNNKILRDRRRDLRNGQTDEEKLLWSKLKNKQLLGARFLRQYSVGPYIVDFYCPKARLAIELDGNQHRENEAALYDKDREQYLHELDIRVVRFWNSEVKTNIDRIIDTLSSLLR